jgi:hypothetical protein
MIPSNQRSYAEVLIPTGISLKDERKAINDESLSLERDFIFL